MKDYRLISTQNYNYFKEALKKQFVFLKDLPVETKNFPDGERYYRLSVDSLAGEDVLLIGGTSSDLDILELFDLGSAIVKYGARSLTILCPYFGYSTMERASKEGEIVVAKTRSRLLSSIPTAIEGNHIWLFDLHSEGITHYFEGNIVSKHFNGKSFVSECLSSIGVTKENSSEYVIGSTDAGRAKYVESLGKHFCMDTSFVYKKRDGNAVSVTGVNANVTNKKVIIYDDMIRSGKSLLNAILAYKSAGAKEVSVISSHAVLLLNALKSSEAQDEILKEASNVFVTNSHPNSQRSNKFKVVDICSLFFK